MCEKPRRVLDSCFRRNDGSGRNDEGGTGFLPSFFRHSRAGGNPDIVQAVKMRFLKRTFDLLIGEIVLIVSFAFWPIIAFVIKIDSKGPVFYIQKRVGKKGKIFSLIKFRSMVESAEENGAMWAHENDKRITPVGRVLRRLHMDELPQVFANLAKNWFLL